MLTKNHSSRHKDVVYSSGYRPKAIISSSSLPLKLHTIRYEAVSSRGLTGEYQAACFITDTPSGASSSHLILQQRPLKSVSDTEAERSAPPACADTTWPGRLPHRGSAAQEVNGGPKPVQTSPQQEQSVPKLAWSKTHCAKAGRRLRRSTYAGEERPGQHFEVLSTMWEFSPLLYFN